MFRTLTTDLPTKRKLNALRSNIIGCTRMTSWFGETRQSRYSIVYIAVCLQADKQCRSLKNQLQSWHHNSSIMKTCIQVQTCLLTLSEGHCLKWSCHYRSCSCAYCVAPQHANVSIKLTCCPGRRIDNILIYMQLCARLYMCLYVRRPI